MFIHGDGELIIDFDLRLLEEITEFIDDRLSMLSDRVDEGQEGVLWLLDRMENLSGLGFVACQTYLASTYGCANIAKGEALMYGPRLSERLTAAQLVNHAANLWKHSNEWVITGNPGPRQSLVNGLGEINYDVRGEYPISGCLAELTNGNARFTNVAKLLVEWRDDLISKQKRSEHNHSMN